jgi:hypothetical protein
VASNRPCTAQLTAEHPAISSSDGRTLATQTADDRATARTLERMAQLAAADSRDPVLQRIARALHTPAAIWQWVRDCVRYCSDAELARELGREGETEVLVRPRDLLGMPEPKGDCDEHAMLCAALLLAAGHQASLRAIEVPNERGSFSHVYAMCGSTALDASHGWYCGWESPHVRRMDLAVLATRTKESMSNLGAINWTDISKTAAETVGTIAKARWGNPPAGVYEQRGDSIYFRQDPRSPLNPLAFGGAAISSNGSMWLLIAGAAVVLLAMRR